MRSPYMHDTLEPIYGRGSYEHCWSQTRRPGKILMPHASCLMHHVSCLEASRFGVIEAPSEFWNFPESPLVLMRPNEFP